MYDYKATQFFIQLVDDILNERERKQEQKNDILGLIMKARANDTNNLLTNEAIARNLMQFFIDGYDTTSSMMSLCLFHLATNPDIMSKAVEEVDGIGDDNITGETVMELQYLDQVFKETNRMANFAYMMRSCTKDWNIPGTDIIWKKGWKVSIACGGIHYDPEYYPDPDAFKPERFAPGNAQKSGTFFPFGIGARQCIGYKMSALEAKMFMFYLLKKFTIEPSEKLQLPMKFDPHHLFNIQGGNWLKLTRRY